MLSNVPTIGIRFDIDKLQSGSYGVAAWKVFWRTIDPKEIRGALFFEGDTAATLANRERVFCIAVQSMNAETVKRVQSVLRANPEYQKVCAEPMFIEGSRCTGEPLPGAGKVDSAGDLVGDAWNARSALGTVKKERQPATEESASLGQAPSRPKPASVRTRDLPSLTTFEELRKFVKKTFTPKECEVLYTYWMTPEELCDLVEQYADMLEVQFDEYSCPRSEDLCSVRLFQKSPPEGRPIELIGLFPFPSRADAARFLEEYTSNPKYSRVLPKLAGIVGKYQLNFGQGTENSRDITYEKDKEIPASELWPKLYARRVRLGMPVPKESAGDSPTTGNKPWWKFW